MVLCICILPVSERIRHIYLTHKTPRMSSNFMAELGLLGSERSIIDAYSNLPLTQSTQQNTYRTPYLTTGSLPYTTTTSSYHHLGYSNVSTENNESKKMLNDVKMSVVFNLNFNWNMIIFSYKINFVY